jgi:hypothetical protein
MQVLASSSRVAAVRCNGKTPSVFSSSSRKLAVRVRAGTEYDRDTGFVAEDNSGRSNIFPRKQQAYIKSSTSDAAAQQGLGGALGGIVVAVVIAAVVAVTVLETKAPGPETLQSVSDAVSGDSLTAIAGRIQASL